MSKISKRISSEKLKSAGLLIGIIFTIVTFLLTFLAVLNPDPFIKYGYLGIFTFNLVGAGTLLVPVLARYLNIYMLALVSSAGMAVNDTVSWYVGKSGDVIIPRSKRVIKTEKTLHKHGPYGLLFFAFIPWPYDFIGLIAGYLEFPFWRFWIPTFIGRFLRFVLLGYGVIGLVGLA